MGSVTASRHRHLLIGKIERSGAPLVAIANDEPVWVFRPNRRNNDPMGFETFLHNIFDTGRFVEKIETDLIVGNALVPFGKGRPVHRTDFEGFRVAPGALGFGRLGNGIAGRTMKIHVDVNPIFFAEPNGFVNVFENFFVDTSPVVVDDPHPTVHRQSHEVESEIADPAEVVFTKALILTVEFFEQIESSPLGKFIVPSHREFRGLCSDSVDTRSCCEACESQFQ